MQKCLIAFLLLCSCLLTAQKKPAPFSLPPRVAGQKSAPLVLEVFTDFECGHCREYYLRTLTRVMEDYCAKGKVYLIHHEYPLRGHVLAPEAARWAVASAAVGKYETVTEALFTKQAEWAVSHTLNIEGVVASAVSPAELAKIKKVMEDHKDEIETAIQADLFAGTSIKVDQTPTTKMMYKGSFVSVMAGNISFAILKKILDDQLAK